MFIQSSVEPSSTEIRRTDMEMELIEAVEAFLEQLSWLSRVLGTLLG